MNQSEKADLLRRLHAGPDVLVLPNAWDAVSARIVEAEGFPVVATTSAGLAAVLGYADGQRIPQTEMLFLIGKIAGAVDIPVTADIEAGYDDAIQTAHDVIASGAVGMNIEDMAGRELIPLPRQIETIRAVKSVSAEASIPLIINARTDIFLGQIGDSSTRFDRAVERLNGFYDAGADCLFAPGVTDRETIARLVAAVRGPLNILATVGSPSIAEMKGLGVRRVSLGSGPSRVALGTLQQFVRTLRDQGTFSALATDALPYQKVQALLSRN